MPVPHLAVHAVQSPNHVMAQSTGHKVLPHAWRSPSDGHGAPPQEDLVATVRVRRWEPVPQVLLHVLQLSNVPATQSTGHSCELQATVLVNEPQRPPNVAGLISVRV